MKLIEAFEAYERASPNEEPSAIYKNPTRQLSWTIHGTNWRDRITYGDHGYDATPLIDIFKKNEHFKTVAAPSVGFAFEEE